MCQISKNVNVDELKKQLFRIANGLKAEAGKVQATMVLDENYTSMTAVMGNQVLCINFMN